MALLFAAGSVHLLGEAAQASEDDDFIFNKKDLTNLAVQMAVPATIEALSAGYGYVTVRDCRDALAARSKDATAQPP